MHFRVQTNKDKNGNPKPGKSVSLLRYAYDREKKRSGQIVLGTVDRWATTLPPELESKLTDAEREEFRNWAAERDRLLIEQTQKHHLLHAAGHIGWAAKALTAGIGPAQPERIWDALDVLAKALEKTGYPRPARARGRPSKDETPTPDGLLSEHSTLFLMEGVPYASEDQVAEWKAHLAKLSSERDEALTLAEQVRTENKSLETQLASLQRQLQKAHAASQRTQSVQLRLPRRLSPDEFKAEIQRKGWTYRDLATYWGVPANLIGQLARDGNRPLHWDDAVRSLPIVVKT